MSKSWQELRNVLDMLCHPTTCLLWSYPPVLAVEEAMKIDKERKEKSETQDRCSGISSSKMRNGYH